MESEPAAGGAQPQPALGGMVVVTSYTVSGNFTTGGNGSSVSLDLSAVNDMGSDDVEVYAATGATPTSRSTGSGNRRAQWSSAPAMLPNNVAGGTWTAASNYWVQVINTTDSVWYQGALSASSGRHNIILRKQAW
ncbi:MAG: hypothetical protein ACYTG2_07100 [Planctomycetota bacterium]|jgi:hypothetical protein